MKGWKGIGWAEAANYMNSVCGAAGLAGVGTGAVDGMEAQGGGTWASGGVSASLTKLLRPLGYVSCQPPPHRYLFTQVIDGSVNLQGR